jgi:ABC-type transport system involved in cytochrome c biogenesis ATPase subunit
MLSQHDPDHIQKGSLGEMSALQYMQQAYPGTSDLELRGKLGAFGISGDLVLKVITKLNHYHCSAVSHLCCIVLVHNAKCMRSSSWLNDASYWLLLQQNEMSNVTSTRILCACLCVLLHRHTIQPLRCLSGGQRARVILTRLVNTMPDLLLLDEPSNHLDGDAVNGLKRELSAYNGAVFFASHDQVIIHSLYIA